MRVVDLDKGKPPRTTVLSYGTMRAGKTRWAASFPRPLFLADATESGWTTIEGMQPEDFYELGRKPEVWAIEKAADMMQAVTQIEADLRATAGKWRSVVVDSLTFYSDTFYNALYSGAVAGGRSPDLRQIYGQLANHLRDLRVRLHSLPLNVVWLCLEKSPGEENPFGGPMIPGQSAQKFAAGVDYLLYHRCFQPNPQVGPQWEIRSRQFGAYKAGGRDGGLLPDPLTDCTYKSFAEALGLPAPLQAAGNGQQQVVVPQRRIVTPGRTLPAR